MKKLDKIFFIIILLELILLTPFLIIKDPCPSPCRVDGILNPLNIFQLSQKTCLLICEVGYYPITYLIIDFLILTILLYILTKLIQFIRR